ncbi:MAG: ABC transporter ATP-binding protein [Verrucomicrobia bacterium]|nr:ABC transporter ATP-binding protein [Verrucomicrobiota bacterium]MBR5738021.1 ABC transporter ATP-binding protein [Verrucomicrobiota bacterium]
MEILRFENITKKYGQNTVLEDVSFSINAGEVFSLLGPSGCGKTTLLRICGGFEPCDSGRVILDGVDITDQPPNERAVRTVFQNYALFPHMTVWDNVAFGLKATGVDPKTIKEEVPKYLELVQLSGFENRKPAQLSGGQRQRVAIARALINKPKVLLLDEPLAALDLKLRQRMLIELDTLHDNVGITFIFVTHDQQEAMSISDHIAVLKSGKIKQIGTPTELYEAPKSSFVAAFIGDTNFFEGTVTNLDGDYCDLQIEDFPLLHLYNDKNVKEGALVHISIRPEKFSVYATKPEKTNPKTNLLFGKVEEVIYLGAHTRYWIRVQDWRISVIKQHYGYALDERSIKWGDFVWLSFEADNAYMLDQYLEDDEELLALPDLD